MRTHLFCLSSVPWPHLSCLVRSRCVCALARGPQGLLLSLSKVLFVMLRFQKGVRLDSEPLAGQELSPVAPDMFASRFRRTRKRSRVLSTTLRFHRSREVPRSLLLAQHHHRLRPRSPRQAGSRDTHRASAQTMAPALPPAECRRSRWLALHVRGPRLPS